jgi:transposase
MSRRKNDPLRALTAEERATLERVSRAPSAPAVQVTRAKQLLVVADGASYLAAAHATGRRSNDAVSRLVSRFNREGLAALEPRHGGHPAIIYGPAERERILLEFRRPPDRARDGTATWSLTSLQHALRTAPDGLPHVSTFTILMVLHEAGLSWQRDRSWCDTGTVTRVRKGRAVRVTDPDAQAKKA